MNIKTESPRSTKRTASYAALALLGMGGAFGLAYGELPKLFSVSYEAAPFTASPVVEESTDTHTVTHLPTPTPLKAIYMTQCVVGTPDFRESLVRFVEDTELNALVIDIKDYSGGIAFPTQNPALAPYVSTKCGAKDMRAFIARLHEKNIYVIGRITVFQDPLYTAAHPELAVKKASATTTPWQDYKGLSFVDVGATPFWEYIVALAKESYALGFDELNFDYVRYPSDGNMKDVYYAWSEGRNKPEVLEEFFSYLSSQLHTTGAVLSADLFGMTTTNTDDLNIGQVLERALPYFDAIYPMVYPSHYPSGFHGYANVNEHAYDIIKYSMEQGLTRLLATTTSVVGFAHERLGTSTPALYSKPVYSSEKLAPWLQSFDYPVHYSPDMVREQIQATYDSGLTSWIFWDAGNKYTSLRAVLAPTPASAQ